MPHCVICSSQVDEHYSCFLLVFKTFFYIVGQSGHLVERASARSKAGLFVGELFVHDWEESVVNDALEDFKRDA